MSKKDVKPLKITPTKGRPMLDWVGKKPLDTVPRFPAQLCRETVGVKNPPAELTFEKFAQANYNLLFHGDNKEVLASLLFAGFRGKVDLIYIDPPFDSGADYVRRVKLRGAANGNGNGRVNGNGNGNRGIKGEAQTGIEQVQYEDIWANDNYLQFMYERLILLHQLLSEQGSIYLHCDWHKSHYLRFLLDEVFGADNFRNEIVWCYHDKFATGGKSMDRNHDIILHYSKTGSFIGNQLRVAKPQTTRRALRKKVKGVTMDILDENGNKIYKEYSDKKLDDVWIDIGRSISQNESTGYPTQKKSELIERIMDYGSEDNSIVLDCFCGSGTTAAAAEKLGRRWIMADLNKGAIQTTMKRIQCLIDKKNGQLGKNGRGLVHYQVNNYDCAEQNALKKIIISKYGIQINRKDLFFDGICDGNLAKIIELNKPLTGLDIQIIKDEIAKNRSDEIRGITVFCNGAELGIIEKLSKEKRPVNKFTVVDLQSEGIITKKEAQAKVDIDKKGKTVTVKIKNYFSPTILARLEMDGALFNKRIGDFRAQIDYVLIDTDYKAGKPFDRAERDVPKKITEYIKGKYTLDLPRAGTKVAVKIVDMLGEETLIVK